MPLSLTVKYLHLHLQTSPVCSLICRLNVWREVPCKKLQVAQQAIRFLWTLKIKEVNNIT